MVRKTLDLLHKKCKLGGGYVRGQMSKNANVICEGSLSVCFVRMSWNFIQLNISDHPNIAGLEKRNVHFIIST